MLLTHEVRRRKERDHSGGEMPELTTLSASGYSFLKGGFPYSQGVCALPGYAIERVRFARPVPIARGFAAIEAYLQSLGRPRLALCAAELRSPQQLSMSGFRQFNEGYVEVLRQWGLFRDGLNPVARSNVVPRIGPPAEPSFYAFCYTVRAQSESGVVVAGSGEWPEGGRFPEDIVARGDVSAAGVQAKARCVLETMDRRLKALGGEWPQVTGVQVYSVHDIHAVVRDEIVPRAGNGGGLTWHYCWPPIEELEYEMDVRSVALERVLSVQ
jgi:enamine deaminase RidA (YjgF/YER057c/UK114 family)